MNINSIFNNIIINLLNIFYSDKNYSILKNIKQN